MYICESLRSTANHLKNHLSKDLKVLKDDTHISCRQISKNKKAILCHCPAIPKQRFRRLERYFLDLFCKALPSITMELLLKIRQFVASNEYVGCYANFNVI